MTREQYLKERADLMNEAQSLLDAGKLEEAAAKAKEVEDLDNKYEQAAKAQANLNALRNAPRTAGMENAAVSVGSASVVGTMGAERKMDDLYDSQEYKRAFQAYVMSGTPIPANLTNADATTKTTDVPAVIPSTTLQKIYEKMERIGMVLPLVTRTGYKGGLSVPTSSVKPTATWVAEGAGSDKQKVPTGTITFANYKLRCAVAQTYEVDNMAYPMFETLFVNSVSNAMVKAKETAIIKGTGAGQPKGILTEAAAHEITVAKGASITYKQLCEAEGAEEDDNAKWAMTKSTYMNQIEGMVDNNGQPVARTNYGINGKPEYTIRGRQVVLLNSDYIASWESAPAESNVIAFLYNFGDYIFNSSVAMTVKRYYDEDIDDTVTKAIEICDGKSVRNDSLVTITLQGSAT